MAPSKENGACRGSSFCLLYSLYSHPSFQIITGQCTRFLLLKSIHIVRFRLQLLAIFQYILLTIDLPPPKKKDLYRRFSKVPMSFKVITLKSLGLLNQIDNYIRCHLRYRPWLSISILCSVFYPWRQKGPNAMYIHVRPIHRMNVRCLKAVRGLQIPN